MCKRPLYIMKGCSLQFAQIAGLRPLYYLLNFLISLMMAHLELSNPVSHFAMIYIQNGTIETSGSSYTEGFFTPEIKEKFLETWRLRPKDHYLNTDVANADNDSSDAHSGTPLMIGDSKELLKFYDAAFRAFQQLNCRQIAKALIKIIEPRKQVKHPYNGGKPGKKRDSDKTKPNWWPTGVTHREPDHLRKPERVRLLIHLVRHINVDKLQEAGEDVRRTIKPPERFKILDEIFRVRRREEEYERGELDGSTPIYVIYPDLSNKRNRRFESSEADSNSVQEADLASPTILSTTATRHTPVQCIDTTPQAVKIQPDYTGSRTSTIVTPGELPSHPSAFIPSAAIQHLQYSLPSGIIINPNDQSQTNFFNPLQTAQISPYQQSFAQFHVLPNNSISHPQQQTRLDHPSYFQQ